jgi:hypothetical protein
MLWIIKQDLPVEFRGIWREVEEIIEAMEWEDASLGLSLQATRAVKNPSRVGDFIQEVLKQGPSF